MTTYPPVAIVGIGGVLPGASNLAAFWDNIAEGVDCSREPPPGRWVLPVDEAYHATRGSADKVYSRRACFVDDFELDLRGLDIDTDFAERLDPMVQLALVAGAAAWRNSETGHVDRSKVGVILGNIALPTQSTSKMADWILGRQYTKSLLAGSDSDVPDDGFRSVADINRYVTGLPAGILAKALGLGGVHFTLDAACASSLFALKHAVEELQSGRADAMLSGGLSRPDSLYTQMGFAQLSALSPSGHCSPFSESADGLVVGEGAGIVVLKRLDDAVTAGDHIYAVIRGIGLSNDVDGNLLAPSEEGQLRSMRAAYRQAGWLPEQVDLIECHATGTKVGDAVEYGSLRTLWGESGWYQGQCTIGSVKSNVGHLLTGAGAAGLLKVLLALKNETLPPTANFAESNSDLDLSVGPFTVRRRSIPWRRREPTAPRRAAVSGFGFGGTNAHLLLEEWLEESAPARPTTAPEGSGKDEIVIVGMGAACGPWRDLTELQHRVLGNDTPQVPQPAHPHGDEAKAPPGWYLEQLDIPTERFRIPPTEIRQTLPQQLLMLEGARQAPAGRNLTEVPGNSN